MIRSLALAAALAAAPVAAQVPEKVFCSFDLAKPVACRKTDVVGRDGRHVLTFATPARQVRIVGRAQTGWWSATLDGKPAMGLELNRGFTRFSTTDLSHTFDWWYPGQEHGTY